MLLRDLPLPISSLALPATPTFILRPNPLARGYIGFLATIVDSYLLFGRQFLIYLMGWSMTSQPLCDRLHPCHVCTFRILCLAYTIAN
jgi:hypothetical protein